MRSRFSAFATGRADYLLRTWHATTRPPRVELDPECRWSRLEVLGGTGGGVFHREGTVEFRAGYVIRGRGGELWENSRFRRDEGAWYYLDAVLGRG